MVGIKTSHLWIIEGRSKSLLIAAQQFQFIISYEHVMCIFFKLNTQYVKKINPKTFVLSTCNLIVIFTILNSHIPLRLAFYGATVTPTQVVVPSLDTFHQTCQQKKHDELQIFLQQ